MCCVCYWTVGRFFSIWLDNTTSDLMPSLEVVSSLVLLVFLFSSSSSQRKENFASFLGLLFVKNAQIGRTKAPGWIWGKKARLQDLL